MCGVPFTLGGTRFARDGADTAHLGGQWAASCHDPHSSRARVGAVTVQTNAQRECSGVGLVEARVCAYLTGHKTLHAGLETRVVRHTLTAEERAEIDSCHENSGLERVNDRCSRAARTRPSTQKHSNPYRTVYAE